MIKEESFRWSATLNDQRITDFIQKKDFPPLIRSFPICTPTLCARKPTLPNLFKKGKLLVFYQYWDYFWGWMIVKER